MPLRSVISTISLPRSWKNPTGYRLFPINPEDALFDGEGYCSIQEG